MKRKLKKICRCGHAKKDHWKDTYCRECGIDMSDLNINFDPVCPRFKVDNLISLEKISGS